MTTAIAICTCQRPSSLATALQSCLDQTVAAEEIIVIDDGDLEDTFVQSWSHRFADVGVKLIYHRKPAERRGLTISRNIAWQLASSDVVLYLDDDGRLGGDCLDRLGRVFEADVDRSVAGADFPIREARWDRPGRRWIERLYSWAGLWCVLKRFHRRRPVSASLARFSWLAQVPYLRGGAMAVRRDVLARIGGFDETLTGHAMGEDKEISIRLARVGLLVRIVSTAVDHSSEPAGREDAAQLGHETMFNYLYINTKAYPLGVGEWILLGYTACALCAIEWTFAWVGDRVSHLRQLKGMLTGLIDFVRWALRHIACHQTLNVKH